MKKVFEKHETLFCLLFIFLYIAINSFCLQNFGNTGWVTLVANCALSASLFIVILLLKRTAYYGLTKVRDAKKYFYFLPLIILVSVNLWNGLHTDYSAGEIIFYVLTMLNVGFIEEIIFRGFLFKMMAKTNIKFAILVSAITFGIGHIVNLLNGADILPTLMQICYATATGYLFVLIFHKSKSLVPCIITHALVNSLSVFHVENTLSLYIAPVVMTAVPLFYAFYIHKNVPEQ